MPILSLALLFAHPAVVPPMLSPSIAQDRPWQQARPLRRREGGGILARRRADGEAGEAFDAPEGDVTGLPPGSVTIRYGTSAAQRILFWPAPAGAPGAARPPLAVFIHGGGWQHGSPEMVAEKPAWFAAHGWAFASVGYRLLPDAPVEEQAADVGRALARLRSEAAARGYDPDRILLFGHSAGAHLTALVATDPRYAGDAFAAIRGAIPVDGAAYDVPRQMADSGRIMLQRTYMPAFGSDTARQRLLSPTSHVGGADVADWLFLYDSQRDDAVSQSALLAGGLERAGARAQQIGINFDGRNVVRRHRRMNVEFGTMGYAGNAAVEAMMRRIEAAR